MSEKKQEPVHATIIDIRPWWFIQFPERFVTIGGEIKGMDTVFKDPNEPGADSYARSPVVLYPEKFEVFAQLPDGKRASFQFLRNPHVNIGDKVEIARCTEKYQYLGDPVGCFYDEISKNITQENMIADFLKKYKDQQNTGLILHISYFQNTYMPGYGSNHDFKEITNPCTRIHRVSVNPESGIFVATPNGEKFYAKRCICYAAFTPGDIVEIDNGTICKLISNIKTR